MSTLVPLLHEKRGGGKFKEKKKSKIEINAPLKRNFYFMRKPVEKG